VYSVDRLLERAHVRCNKFMFSIFKLEILVGSQMGGTLFTVTFSSWQMQELKYTKLIPGTAECSRLVKSLTQPRKKACLQTSTVQNSNVRGAVSENTSTETCLNCN